MAQAEREGHKSEWMKRGPVPYSTDRENEISKIMMLLFSYILGANSKFLQLDIGCAQVHNLSRLGMGEVRIFSSLNK